MRKEEQRSRARELERAGQAEAARELYVALAQQEEPEGAAIVWRRIAHLDQVSGKRSAARESLHRAAQLFAEAGQPNNALATCLHIVEVSPDDAASQLKLVELAIAQGYRELARTWAISSAAAVVAAAVDDQLDNAARLAAAFGERFAADADFWQRWVEGAAAAGDPRTNFPLLRRLHDGVEAYGAPPQALLVIREQLGRLASAAGPDWHPDAVFAQTDGGAPGADAAEAPDAFINPGPLLSKHAEETAGPDDPVSPPLSLREAEPIWAPSSARVIQLEGFEPTHGGWDEPGADEAEESAGPEELPLLGDAISASPPEPPLLRDAISASSPEPPLLRDAISASSPEPPLLGDTFSAPSPEPPLLGEAISVGSPEPPLPWLHDLEPGTDEDGGVSGDDLPLLDGASFGGPAMSSYPEPPPDLLELDDEPAEPLPLLDAASSRAGGFDPDDPLAFLDEPPDSRSPSDGEPEHPAAAGDLPLHASPAAALHRELDAIVTRQVESSDPVTHYDLGLAFKEMGLIDEAVAQIAAAITGGYRTVAGLEVLGEILHARGEHSTAGRILRLATQQDATVDGELVGVLYWLARTEEALGNHLEARQLLGRVVAVDPSFRDASRRLSSTGSALF